MREQGKYLGRAKSWGWTETSSGNAKFWMAFEILGRCDDASHQLIPGEGELGSAVWSITPATDKAEDWLVEVVRHLGYDRDDLLGLDPDRDGAFNFEGVEFVATCKHEEYEGQLREKWAVHLPPKAKPLGRDKLQALNARLSNKFQKAKERQQGKDKNASGFPPTPADDADTVPF